MATHYVPAVQLPALQAALGASPSPLSVHTVKAILDQFSAEPPAHDAIPNLKEINHCFGPHHASLESVITALKADTSSWAKDTLQALTKASPTSLRVVFRELREGSKMNTLAECLKMEYRIADTFLHPEGPSRDFFEGVRATLVDKDKLYKWSPALLENVTEQSVRPFFDRTPTGGNLVL